MQHHGRPPRMSRGSTPAGSAPRTCTRAWCPSLNVDRRCFRRSTLIPPNTSERHRRPGGSGFMDTSAPFTACQYGTDAEYTHDPAGLANYNESVYINFVDPLSEVSALM